MLKSRKMLAAIAALLTILCCAVLPAAEGVPAPAKPYAEMTLEEMVAYFRTLNADQIVLVYAEISQTNDDATIGTAGKAIVVIASGMNETDRAELLKKFYEANKGIVLKDNGVVLPSSRYFALDANPLKVFAAGNDNVQSNSELVEEGGDIPQRHDPLSMGPSYPY